MILDILKRLGGSGMAGGGTGATDDLEADGQAGQQSSPNLRHLLGNHVGGAGGSYIDMMRQGRRTGEMPGQQMSMGMAGGNFNQGTSTPTPFAQESSGTTGGVSSLFDNFDADKFKKRLGHMGAGWAMGNNFNESVRLGNLTASLGERLPEEQMNGCYGCCGTNREREQRRRAVINRTGTGHGAVKNIVDAGKKRQPEWPARGDRASGAVPQAAGAARAPTC